MILEEQIKQHIGNGKTKEALDLLTPYTDDALLLRSRLSRLQQDDRMGVIDRGDYMREMARINYSIISLLESDGVDLPKEAMTASTTANSNNTSAANSTKQAGQKPKVFVSYAHDDSAALREMQSMLQILKKNGTIDIWTDSEILPGQNFSQVIKDSLMRANIVLLLISSSFLNSDYIWRNEMQIALKNSKEGKAIVIPIILRPCLWKEVKELAELQALPMNDDGRLVPIVKWEDKDEAWMKVAEGLKKVIATITK